MGRIPPLEERAEHYAPLEERLDDFAPWVDDRDGDFLPGDAKEVLQVIPNLAAAESIVAAPTLHWSDLNYRRVVRLWNAVSFHTWQYGEVMSANIIIVWRGLEVTNHAKARHLTEPMNIMLRRQLHLMLDVDFLSAAHPLRRQHVIYQYSTGLLRSLMRIRLNQLYTAKGLICVDAPPDDPLHSIYVESLVGPEAIFIDTACHPNIAADLPISLPLETTAVSNSVIFFVPEGAAFLQTPSLLAFSKTAMVLEELRLSKTAVPKLVAFFGLRSTVFDYRQLTNKADLLAALQETLKFERDWTLVEFQKRLEFLALMCIVEQTFDKALFRKYAPPSSKEDFYTFHRAVFEFLLAKTPEKLIPVVTLFSREYVTPPKARMLVGLLYKITFDIFVVNLELNPKGQVPEDWSAYKKAKLMACKGLPVANLYKWTNILTREESRFYKRNSVAALHDVCWFYVESFDAPLCS